MGAKAKVSVHSSSRLGMNPVAFNHKVYFSLMLRVYCGWVIALLHVILTPGSSNIVAIKEGLNETIKVSHSSEYVDYSKQSANYSYYY